MRHMRLAHLPNQDLIHCIRTPLKSVVVLECRSFAVIIVEVAAVIESAECPLLRLQHGTDVDMWWIRWWHDGTDDDISRNWSRHLGTEPCMLRNRSWHAKERILTWWNRCWHVKEQIVTNENLMKSEQSHFHRHTAWSPIWEFGLVMVSSVLYCRQYVARCPVVGCTRIEEAECQSRMSDLIRRNRWWHDGTRAGMWRNRWWHGKERIMTGWNACEHVKELNMTVWNRWRYV